MGKDINQQYIHFVKKRHVFSYRSVTSGRSSFITQFQLRIIRQFPASVSIIRETGYKVRYPKETNDPKDKVDNRDRPLGVRNSQSQQQQVDILNLIDQRSKFLVIGFECLRQIIATARNLASQNICSH